MNELNDTNYNEIVKAASKPVIIDFYAEWCPPCKMFTPIFERLAKELTDYDFYKVDTEVSTNTVTQEKVSSIPCFLVYQDGIVKGKTTGLLKEADFKAWIAKCLA